MIRRNTWILLIIFGLMIVLAILFPKIKESLSKKEGKVTPTVGVTTLFSFDATQVAYLRVEDSSGKLVAIRRNESGLWELTEPVGNTDTAAVDTIISQFTGLRAMVTLDPSTDMTIYGLSRPAYYINVNLNGGEKLTVIVGDITPTKSGYYVRVDEQPPVVVSKSSIEKIIGVLVTPPFMPTSTPEPTIPVTTTVTATLSVTATSANTATPTFTVTPTPTQINSPTLPITPTVAISPTISISVTPTKQP